MALDIPKMLLKTLKQCAPFDGLAYSPALCTFACLEVFLLCNKAAEKKESLAEGTQKLEIGWE